MKSIPVAGPWITEKEIASVTDAVTNAWYGNANVYHERFESAFARFIGVKHAVALPSCTSAIHLSLLALGVGPGDEVIVPDITWIASAAPVTYVGATIVFADIDPMTWCLSPDSFAECITPRTKAVIPVDLYGGMPDMDAIKVLAEKNGIAVIEDAAQAIGSEYHGRKAGSFGDVGVFSFHGSKTLTTGEGGMLLTDRKDLLDRVLVLRDHGRHPDEPRMFFNHEVGFKYRMSSMQAALGLAQLERLKELIEKKRKIFQWYADRLESAEGLTLNAEPPQTLNSYWMVTVILDERLGIKKESLMACLWKDQIASRPFFYPLSSLPAFERSLNAHNARERNRTCQAISPFGVNLPSALLLSEDDVGRVCSTMSTAVHRLAQ